MKAADRGAKRRTRAPKKKDPPPVEASGGHGLFCQAGRFVARLTLVYGLLLVLWGPFGFGYRKALVAVGNNVAGFVSPAGSVSFRAFSKGELGEGHSRADVGVLVHHLSWRDAQGRNQHVLAKRIATFYQPYSATAFLLALLAASQVSLRRRLIGGALALAVLYLGMFACVAVDVVFAFASNGALPTLPRWLFELTAFLHVSVTDWPAGVLIAPLVVWLAVLWPGRKDEPVNKPKAAESCV